MVPHGVFDHQWCCRADERFSVLFVSAISMLNISLTTEVEMHVDAIFLCLRCHKRAKMEQQVSNKFFTDSSFTDLTGKRKGFTGNVRTNNGSVSLKCPI